MSAEKYLQMIQQDIHSVVFATTDENHFPVTYVIDIMLADKDGLYFLTARGKAFYARLKNHHMQYFFVTDQCIGCKLCVKVCPQNCIDISSCSMKIQQKHCLHCAKCQEVCPMQAIERRTL